MRFAFHPQLDQYVTWSEQIPLLAPAFTPETQIHAFTNPYPGVGMALCLVASDYERRSNPRWRAVRVLAISRDRRFVARLSVKLYSLSTQDLEYFWVNCANLLAHARSQPLPPPVHWSLEPSMDCLASWTDHKTWRFGSNSCPGQVITLMLRRSQGKVCIEAGDLAEHERNIMERLSGQFSEIVLAFLKSGLDPDLYSLLEARRNLSFSTLYRLISLAADRGKNALRYMQGAIRSESLGVLDLAARDGAVGAAIVEGKSLPILLRTDYDMPAGVHRRSLVRSTSPKHSTSSNPILADLPMSANTLLASLPILRLLSYERWPRTHHRWCDFFGVACELHTLDDIEDGLKQSLLFWLMDDKVVESSSSYYLYMLIGFAKAVCVAAKNLADTFLELREAIAISIDFMENHGYQCPEELLDVDDLGPTLVLVSQISSIDINTLSKSLFEMTPLIPNTFDCSPYVIAPLRDINMCKEHGIEVNACIKAPETAIRYGGGACALYAIKHWTGAHVGTIGCALDRSDPNRPEVGVWEVQGLNNEIDVDLEALSASLAECFSRPEHISSFYVYTESVSAFRFLAGAIG